MRTMNVTEVFVVKVLIPRSPLTRLNVEKQGEGRDDLMTMEIILPMRLLVMRMLVMTMLMMTMIMMMLI